MVILNVFAVRVDIEIAAKCEIDEPIDIMEGEKLAFSFRIPMYTRKLNRRSKRQKRRDGVRGPSGQPKSKLRFVLGQNGRLAISGMVRDPRSTNADQC